MELYLQAQELLCSQVSSCPTNVLEIKLEDQDFPEGRRHVHITTIREQEKEVTQPQQEVLAMNETPAPYPQAKCTKSSSIRQAAQTQDVPNNPQASALTFRPSSTSHAAQTQAVPNKW